MIIVIEGPDATGKTTLARALAGKWPTGATIFHSTHNPNQWEYDTAILRSAVDVHLEGGLAILDRAWIGDNVYGRVFRDGGGAWVRRHDSVLRRYGATYVLAAPPPDVAVKLFEKMKAERAEMYGDADAYAIDRVARMYRNLWSGATSPPPETMNYVEQEIYLNGGWQGRDDVICYDRTLWRSLPAELLLDLARGIEQNVEPWDGLGFNLSGRPGRNVTLLVGERPGGRGGSIGRNWPFFANDGSSRFLTDKLHAARVREVNLAYVNAYRADGSPEPLLEKVANACKRVVTLGQVAAVAVEDVYEGEFTTIKHPQWERRFNHGGDYARLLAEVCR